MFRRTHPADEGNTYKTARRKARVRRKTAASRFDRNTGTISPYHFVKRSLGVLPCSLRVIKVPHDDCSGLLFGLSWHPCCSNFAEGGIGLHPLAGETTLIPSKIHALVGNMQLPRLQVYNIRFPEDNLSIAFLASFQENRRDRKIGRRHESCTVRRDQSQRMKIEKPTALGSTKKIRPHFSEILLDLLDDFENLPHPAMEGVHSRSAPY